MSDANDGSRAQKTSAGPGGRDTNAKLLYWRLILAAFLSISSLFVHFLGTWDVSLPGMLGSLGLYFTTVAVCWAA